VSTDKKINENFTELEANGHKENSFIYVEPMVKPINYSVAEIFNDTKAKTTPGDRTFELSMSEGMSIKYNGLVEEYNIRKEYADKNIIRRARQLPLVEGTPEDMTISAGKYPYKFGYFLPGMSTPSSVVNLDFTLVENVVFPK
jgi:hypothetical protein